MRVGVMRVLVTGGAGYVGSHAAKALATEGFVPITFDDLTEGHRSAVRWGPLVEGALSERQKLVDVMATERVQAVLHFAAKAYVGESMRDPGKYFHNNVIGSLVLLDAMREVGVRTLVFSSSCAAYGLPHALPMTEEHPRHPISPYGESKLFVEKALDWYGQCHGFRSATLRYFNAAGADPDAEIGEIHDPETHLIPIALDVALGRRPHLDVYGTDYDTPDGTCVRDYVHVTDLADGHVQALRHLLDGNASISLNLGTGVGHSVLDVVGAAERASGRGVTWQGQPRRAGDPPMLIADATRARSSLGWQPRFAELASIMDTAWRWHARERR